MSPTSNANVPGAGDLPMFDHDAARAIRGTSGATLGEFLNAFDWSTTDPFVEAADEARQRITSFVPRSAWTSFDLDRYALNAVGDSKDTFSYALEFASKEVGSIGGGSAYKHGIFRGKDGEFHWNGDAATTDEAWDGIRQSIDRMLDDIEHGEWGRIDKWNRRIVWPAIRLKIANVYFPDEIAPVYSQHALKYFLTTFGVQDVKKIAEDAFRLNRSLLAVIRSVPEFDGRDLVAVMHALYTWTDPRLDGTGRKRGAPSADVLENTELAITGEETLEELVDLWYDEDEYPNETDKIHLQRLADFRVELAPDRIANAPLDDLKRVWWPGKNYGNTGPMSVLNRTLKEATEPEIAKFRETVRYLMYGHAPMTQRLDAVLNDDERRVHGLGESVAMKYLAIAQPDRVIPLFPFRGDKGKRAALAALPLDVDVDAFDHLSPSEQQIQSNDALVERVGPLMRSGQMWELLRFLWWATRQAELLDAVESGQDVGGDEARNDDPDTKASSSIQRTAVTLDELSERTFMERDLLAEIANALRSDQPHVILAGPPGTSKTFIADGIAGHLTGGDASSTTTVQLHPSYGYEEFVEGLRPTTGDNGELRFTPESGPLLRVADAARRDPESPQVLIIDEMNRANLPRVFGELLYLLEYRDRSLDLRFHPAFTLPENVAFIGTMNTADRSIRSIDAAIRRRFELFEFMPDPALLERWYASNRGVSHIPDLRAGFERLNGRLTELLDKHHTVGHAFLIKKELTTNELRRIWRRKIGPLVEEYLFDRPELAQELTIEWCWPSMSGGEPS